MHGLARRAMSALLLLCGAWVGMRAQTPDLLDSGPLAMRFQGEREGLPHATIHALAHDPKGCLWVGTKDGVASFNGRAWSSLALPSQSRSNYVRAVAAPPDGSLWVGTQDDGLWQWKDPKWIHYAGPDTLPARRINQLTWTPSGSGYALWVATADAGAARFEAGKWTRWTPQEGLPHLWVWRVRPGRDRVWFATFGGLASLQGDHLRSYALGHSEIGDVLDLRDDQLRGEVWVSAWNHGLIRLDAGSFDRPLPPAGFPDKHPVALAATRASDGDTVIWVGTYDQGLFWRKGSGLWRSLDARQGFPATGVYDLLSGEGGQPTLWVATRGAGVGALDLGGWVRIRPSQYRPPDRVQGFGESVEDGQPVYWFGTERGLLRWKAGRWSILDAPGAFPSAYVNTFLETRIFGRPAMAIATLRGLVLLEGGRARLVADERVLPNALINTLAERMEDGAPALWLGTEGGLARYHRGRWSFTSVKDGLPDDWVHAVIPAVGPGGRDELWVGTRGGGIGRLSGDRWFDEGLTRGLPHPSVNALVLQRLPTGRRRLWAATFGGGLCWLDVDNPAARWQALTVATLPALPSNVVMALAGDAHGRLYASTARGVVRLETGIQDSPAEWTVTTFTESEGLPSRIGLYGALRVDRLGRVWVGTESGMAAFDPRLEAKTQPLRVPRIEAFLASGQPLPIAMNLQVGPKVRNLQVRYDLPLFSRAADLRFQTQVVGLEDAPGPWVIEDWRELTGLGPGSYVFRVRARDHLGRVTPFTELPFRILPPLWRSPWAYALYTLLLLAGSLVVHQLRVGMLRARTRVLKAQVAEATADLKAQSTVLAEANEKLRAMDALKNRMLGIVAHDLRNPIGAVMTYAELLTDPELPKEEVMEVAQHVGQSARFMYELLRRFLDLEAIERGKVEVNLQEVDPTPLLRRLATEQGAKAEAKGLRLKVEVAPGLPTVTADPVYLREVLENLLSNALKFTPVDPPGKTIRLEAGPGWFAVVDEGPGFTPKDLEKVFGKFERLSARPTGGESSTGLGLAIVKSLVEQMGGRVALESAAGEGARFTVRLPLA